MRSHHHALVQEKDQENLQESGLSQEAIQEETSTVQEEGAEEIRAGGAGAACVAQEAHRQRLAPRIQTAVDQGELAADLPIWSSISSVHTAEQKAISISSHILH